ncbi:Tagatose-6-phosphate kinase [Aedoeadaptatus nemausensis]|uniref:Tagatose-6-phosphate kinase n=1 Tax=Aedoeadaptatus nemausensis TaxID=2582829 RepID=A0A6V6Y0B6_9FIRM|nr:PfkB family carbohydrate kinase [Peptoniphilus nemausensis]CAC9924388.1 Tagatose-6-phosphate kinase [Peptoniphilus nemausensis]
MILIIDTNPILERRLTGDSFPKGGRGEATESITSAKGYGADMARLAEDMNEGARLLTFLGGFAGDRYNKLLSQSGIVVESESLRDETQERIILEEKYKNTSIYTKEPRITREDTVDFYERFVRECLSSDVVVIAKGTRSKDPESMKLPMVRYARSKSKPVIILSDERDDVEEVREAKPFGMIIDRSALSKLVKRNLQFLGDIASTVEKLYGDDIPLILVTGSSKGSILYCRGDYFFAKNDEINDYFDPHHAAVAMAAGIVRKYDAPTLLKLTAAAAQSEKTTDFATIKSDMNRINVQTMEV